MLYFGAMVLLNRYVQSEVDWTREIAKVLTIGCAAAFTYNFIRIIDERD